MPVTYEPIANGTFTSANQFLGFTSIPQTYTDLRIVLVYKPTSTGSVIDLRMNGTSGGYSTVAIQGLNSTTAAKQMLSDRIIISGFNSDDSTTFWGFATIDIPSYASTSVTKSCLITTSWNKYTGTTSAIYRAVGLYPSTSAITQLQFQCGNLFDAGSTATLYGITKA